MDNLAFIKEAPHYKNQSHGINWRLLALFWSNWVKCPIRLYGDVVYTTKNRPVAALNMGYDGHEVTAMKKIIDDILFNGQMKIATDGQQI